LEKFLSRDWSSIVKTCNFENWKEALATILTYTRDSDQLSLCNLLGARLEETDSTEFLLNACLCYICAPDLDKFVLCWQKLSDKLNFSSDSDSLQVIKIKHFKYTYTEA
jgi:protein transport protein SEC31